MIGLALSAHLDTGWRGRFAGVGVGVCRFFGGKMELQDLQSMLGSLFRLFGGGRAAGTERP
jgi:hypothetical protein